MNYTQARADLLRQALDKSLPGTKQVPTTDELIHEMLSEPIEQQPEIRVVKSDPRDKLFWVGLVVGFLLGVAW